MKIITFQDITNLNIEPANCYEWAETMIRNKKQTIFPPKNSLKPRDGVFCNVMPSMVPDADNLWGGVKIVTRYPGRVPSLESRIMLMMPTPASFSPLRMEPGSLQ